MTITVRPGNYVHDTIRGPLHTDRQLNPATLAMLVAAFIELTDTHGYGWGMAVRADIDEGYVGLTTWTNRNHPEREVIEFRPDPHLAASLALEDQP